MGRRGLESFAAQDDEIRVRMCEDIPRYHSTISINGSSIPFFPFNSACKRKKHGLMGRQGMYSVWHHHMKLCG